jgi:glycosyltransferase involved in cell wall biosynthesis
VTVVIAAYNRSEVLRYALASALVQSHDRLEVLVIGDACTDDSGAVVESSADPRATWINLPRNSGSQAGPNRAGLERARGELVAYLGQDDLWRRDHVARLVARQRETGADLVTAACEHVWPGRLGARRFNSVGAAETNPPSALLHTAVAGQRAGGWIDHRATVRTPDVDFVSRLLASGARHARLDALTVVKFASALRPGSYAAHRSDEQAGWSARIDRRSFVARELAAAALLMPLRQWSPHAPVPAAARAEPGGVVSEFRRIRGLD